MPRKNSAARARFSLRQFLTQYRWPIRKPADFERALKEMHKAGEIAQKKNLAKRHYDRAWSR